MSPDLCKCSPNNSRIKTAVQQAETVPFNKEATWGYQITPCCLKYDDLELDLRASRGIPASEQAGWGEDFACTQSLMSLFPQLSGKLDLLQIQAQAGQRKMMKKCSSLNFVAFYFKYFVVLCLDTSCGCGRVLPPWDHRNWNWAVLQLLLRLSPPVWLLQCCFSITWVCSWVTWRYSRCSVTLYSKDRDAQCPVMLYCCIIYCL